MARRIVAFALPLVLLFGGLAPAQEAERPGHEVVRGVTVSCQTWGWEWGSDDMLVALDEIKALGGNWVAIHPYARIRGDGSVGSRRLFAEDSPRWLTRPIAEAHARGIKVLIKPHLAYWGSPFRWRGEISFKTPAEWERFWTGYDAWILRVVELCKDADAFVVGTELDKTLGYEQRWRGLIAKVRQRTKAPLTYAANWTDYRKVGFWDALDVIGVQGYFPLVRHEGIPKDAELAAGWKRILGELTGYAKEQRRKVVFTELGYDRSPEAAVRPWESARRRFSTDPEAAELQERCLQAALRAIESSPDVVGALLWKWFAGNPRGEDFLAQRPGMKKVIRGAWKKVR